MSKIVTVKIIVRDERSPEGRVYERTVNLDNVELALRDLHTLNGEFRFANQVMSTLPSGPVTVTHAVPVTAPAPATRDPALDLARNPNKGGHPQYWKSSDGRTNLVVALSHEHAVNIVRSLHRRAVAAKALNVEEWCLENYPQYEGLRRRAGVPLNRQRPLFSVEL